MELFKKIQSIRFSSDILPTSKNEIKEDLSILKAFLNELLKKIFNKKFSALKKKIQIRRLSLT